MNSLFCAALFLISHYAISSVTASEQTSNCLTYRESERMGNALFKVNSAWSELASSLSSGITRENSDTLMSNLDLINNRVQSIRSNISGKSCLESDGSSLIDYSKSILYTLQDNMNTLFAPLSHLGSEAHTNELKVNMSNKTINLQDPEPKSKDATQIASINEAPRKSDLLSKYTSNFMNNLGRRASSLLWRAANMTGRVDTKEYDNSHAKLGLSDSDSESDDEGHNGNKVIGHENSETENVYDENSNLGSPQAYENSAYGYYEPYYAPQYVQPGYIEPRPEFQPQYQQPQYIPYVPGGYQQAPQPAYTSRRTDSPNSPPQLSDKTGGPILRFSERLVEVVLYQLEVVGSVFTSGHSAQNVELVSQMQHKVLGFASKLRM